MTRRAWSWLAIALLASAAAMAWAASRLRPELAGAAAIAFVMLLILTALRSNRRLWHLPIQPDGATAAPAAGVDNAGLIALAYGWGAAAMTTVYTWTGLVWQHGLQYAAGMGTIALLLALYARGLARPDSVLRSPVAQRFMLRLTLAHATAAAAGVAMLFVSGKLKSGRGDWAANIVFVIGGVTVFALSIMAATTQHRLAPRR